MANIWIHFKISQKIWWFGARGAKIRICFLFYGRGRDENHNLITLFMIFNSYFEFFRWCKWSSQKNLTGICSFCHMEIPPLCIVNKPGIIFKSRCTMSMICCSRHLLMLLHIKKLLFLNTLVSKFWFFKNINFEVHFSLVITTKMVIFLRWLDLKRIMAAHKELSALYGQKLQWYTKNLRS